MANPFIIVIGKAEQKIFLNVWLDLSHQGGKMNILLILILVAVLMVLALVGTLLVTKERDVVYSGEKSINNQAWIYIALIPVLVITVGLVLWF